MPSITRGLKSKEISTISSVQNCDCCGGTGEVTYGHIDAGVSGLSQLYDTCVECSGDGKKVVPIRKIHRIYNRRSKVVAL